MTHDGKPLGSSIEEFFETMGEIEEVEKLTMQKVVFAALEGKRNERELRECIRQAVSLLEESKRPYTGGLSFGEKRDLWLTLPAVQSAIMLEEADKA